MIIWLLEKIRLSITSSVSCKIEDTGDKGGGSGGGVKGKSHQSKLRRHNSRELPLPSVTITQMSQIRALSPPIVLRCYHPVHPEAQISDTDVQKDGLIINFAMYRRDTMQDSRKGTHTKPAIIELCLRLLVPDYCPTGGYSRDSFLYWWPNKAPLSCLG